ncbi:MAG TPA: hypothetical protein VHC47_09195 [Mucilaginibacter sp.]|nr:hypothetical protein [Mucilaginibacter sp.]
MQKTTFEKWKIKREEPVKPYLTYSIYEGDNPDFAFYFSQIEEWGILKFCTKLQIFKNKTAPERIYDSKSVWFLFDSSEPMDFILDWTFEKLVCFRQLINKGNNHYSYPFVIINLSSLTYAVIDDDSLKTLRREDANSITGIKTTIDKITKDEKEVFENFRLDELEWVSLSKLT